LGKANVASGAPTVTILFISLSAAQYNLEEDWGEAGAEINLRRCPICSQDSIIGHGRRRKQAEWAALAEVSIALYFGASWRIAASPILWWPPAWGRD